MTDGDADYVAIFNDGKTCQGVHPSAQVVEIIPPEVAGGLSVAYLPSTLYLHPDEMVADILAIPHTGLSWSPTGGTFHNTAAPSLGQWNTYSPATRLAWGDNLNRYYRGLGWHAGPHACGTPEGYAIKLGDWRANGVHASCFNSNHYGVETVGNFCHRW